MILMKDIVRDDQEGTVLRDYAAKVSFPLTEEEQQLAKDLMEYLEISQDEELAEKYGLRAGVGLAAPRSTSASKWPPSWCHPTTKKTTPRFLRM